MWILLIPVLSLISVGLLVDWRNKKKGKDKRKNFRTDVKSEGYVQPTMEDDRRQNGGYL